MASLPRTLPASWYCSSPLYQLERRAVFMKAWYLLGPVTRFHVVGEKVDYEIAQVKLTVIRNSEKARDVKVYDTSTGLEQKSYLSITGLLFATISDEAPEFHEYFPDLEVVIDNVDFTKLPYRHGIKYEGRFNWKTMVDGYQECLHCQYTHPSFATLYPTTFYTVYNHKNFSQHVADPNNYKVDDGLFLYFFPNCTLSVYGGGLHSFRVCPSEDPGVTRMEFDYYHSQSGEKFNEYLKFTRQVSMEDYELCEIAQQNLEKGIYAEGILNPVKESGVAFYQQRVLELVCEQHAKDTERREHKPSTTSESDNHVVTSALVDPASS
ncbi:Bet v1-like protein [Delitschia confertaspora ATCC 74209]|uniref:Choline monooxygenase, chloroplastic n=1 Tax=Delitschia confertaspora ATCC 74209 TaxID=1513339 RepID=A0A9P4JTP1_9PLEO|nr:Bet v1-like protein [Delitschia confertaspora ATCC 74209]